MTKGLIRLFVKDSDNVTDAKVRERYGMLAGIVAVVCNVLLAGLKFVLGMASGSIAVTADAFNNLSDVGAAGVTLWGFRMAAKPADKEHPYGHGRSEYIGGLVVAFFVLMVGFEFFKSSVEKILHPEPVVFQWVTVAGLGASILVKLWMSRFQTEVGRRIDSAAMGATAADSISDVMATGVTMAAVIAARFTAQPVDGYMGAVVALIILYTGIRVARDTLTPLLGKAPDPQLLEKVQQMALGYQGILGVHDLIIHDYGPGRIFASMHAEIPMDLGMRGGHALIDRVEKELSQALGIDLVLHMDPQEPDCAFTADVRRQVEQAVAACDPAFHIHDFRAERDGQAVRAVFDVCIPIEYKKSDQAVREKLTEMIRARDARIFPSFVIDRTVESEK